MSAPDLSLKVTKIYLCSGMTGKQRKEGLKVERAMVTVLRRIWEMQPGYFVFVLVVLMGPDWLLKPVTCLLYQNWRPDKGELQATPSDQFTSLQYSLQPFPLLVNLWCRLTIKGIVHPKIKF